MVIGSENGALGGMEHGALAAAQNIDGAGNKKKQEEGVKDGLFTNHREEAV